MRDYRTPGIQRNLASAKKVFVVMSSKGGVGKTTVATLLSYTLSTMGVKVGLLDLDLVNPSTHLLLGVNPASITYKEEKGILPAEIRERFYYVTFASFTSNKPIALSGEASREALREILLITKWGELDYIFIDTPPGISDEHLELIYNLRNIVPIVVSTPSPLSTSSVSKLIEILREAGLSNILFVENMGKGSLRKYAEEIGLVYLGFIPYVESVSLASGSVETYIKGDLSSYLTKIAERIMKMEQP